MKVTSAVVQDFVSRKKLAVAGASRSPLKFGHTAYRTLRDRGYQVYALNPNATEVAGDPCFPDFQSLPGPVDGVVVVVKPAQAEKVVREAAAAGVRRVWLQQGSASAAALRFCAEAGLHVVHGHCILMFAEPVEGFHKFHRGLWRLIGKLPR
jgi:predicted CoA-binding protein